MLLYIDSNYNPGLQRPMYYHYTIQQYVLMTGFEPIKAAPKTAVLPLHHIRIANQYKNIGTGGKARTHNL